MVFISILLGLLPSFAWLFFFLKEDVHPEPKKMIARTFAAGALITFVALGFQILLRNIFLSFQLRENHLISFVFFSFAEEVLKFLAAYFVVRKSRFLDEPIDAMIYIITAALGFAMVENIAVMFSVKTLPEAFGVITMRFVGATLLHALSSGIAGYYWARSLGKANERLSIINGQLVVFGIIFATLLHTVFNYLILISKELFYPTMFLVIIGLLVFWNFEKIKMRC